MRAKRERHIDVDADPSTPSVEESGPLRLVEGHATLASKEYTVKLSAAPTANVTVAVASSAASALTVDTDGGASGLQTALTFTTTNWSTARTVTLAAVDDADFVSENVTITHTAGGGGYTSSQHTSFTLAATVADDEPAQLVVDANPSTTTVADAGPLVLNEGTARTGNYSVKLSRQPTGTTTVALASDNSAVTLSASTLTFTTSNWNSAQTVTATTTQDADSADEAADVTHTASGGGYGGLTATLRVGVTDDERTAADYDTDEDGLIEINSLAQLNAIRWDLDGDGAVAMGDQTNYAAAFSGATTGMGCPDGGDSNQTADPCIGYELTADLDFDTDGSGAGWSESGGDLTCDSNDTYYNSGSGWNPIGPNAAPTDTTHYNAVFEGNGHSIANLCIDRTGRSYVGLFAALRPDAEVRSLGLRNGGVYGGWSTGPLAAQSWGRIVGVWTSGSTRAPGNIGGLIGVQQSGGTVVASYSMAAVHCTATSSSARTGGLVGESKAGSTIFASYAAGAVTGDCPDGVKSGLTSGAGEVEAGYWDTIASGIDDDADAKPPEGRPTGDLQTPTAYGATGLYALWDDQDVDGDGVRGEPNDDDAWNFGANNQYPTLKFGGLSVTDQRTAHPPSFDVSGLEFAFLPNQAIAAVEIPAATHSGAVTYTATGLPTGLDFDGDGSGACSAARTICGTPTVTGTFTVTVWAANIYGVRFGLTVTIRVAAGEVLVDADPTTPAVVDRGSLVLDEGAGRSGNYAVRLAVAPTAAVTVTLASDNPAVTVGASALTFTTSNWDTWQTVTATTTADSDAVDEAADVTHTANGGGYSSVSATLRVGVTDDERTGTDYDTDEDGLIEVATLAQLNAMRWDLDGDGTVGSTNQTSYDAAFPGASTGMGCPDGADANQTADSCDGYELTADLDFDTDGSGYTWRAPGGTLTGDSNDAYYNSGSGWDPISPFNTAFDGNGHTIWNLFINRTTRYTGLFGRTNASADIRSLALRNVRIEAAADTGPLVGLNRGRIAACWASGTVRGSSSVGGLVGSNTGSSTIASYTTASVNSTAGSGGGFAGWHSATIRTSYSIGRVTGGTTQFGFRRGTGTVVASYWDRNTSGVADDADGDPPEGLTTNEMRSPTEYGHDTAFYAMWDDQDVDGDGVSGGLADDAWAFGTKAQYPVLKFDGFDPAEQFAAQGPQARIAATSPAALLNQNLNNATVTVTLTRTAFGSGVTASNFALGGTVPGVRVASVATVSSGDLWATLTLAYDGASFTDDRTLTVTVAAAAHTQAGNLTTAPVKVGADVVPTFSGTVSDTTVRNGQPIDPIQVPAATGGEGVGHTYEASGMPTGVVFDADGSGTCQQARTFCGTPTVDEAVTVTVHAHDGDANRANTDRATLTFTMTVVSPTAAITATDPAALAEATLDGATVTVTLTDSTFVSGAAVSGFQLNTGVPGLSVSSVTAVGGGTTATLTLGHTGADFDSAETLGVTVLAAAHALKGNIATATVAVATSLEATASPTNLSLNEAAGTTSANEGTFTAVLQSQPAADTTVTVTSADLGAATVSPSELTFTTTDWSTAQTVTVTAQQDDDTENESTTVTLTAAGVGELASVTVTVADDDLGTVVVDADPSTDAVDPGPLALGEGDTETYAVRLSAQPTADVTVDVASDDAGAVSVASGSASLTFTTANWNVAQTVTVTAEQDGTAVDESATVTHTATGGGYGGTSTELRVAVSDDERTGTDYDTDEDGLIEISTLAQLNAVRWDLDGNGAVSMTDSTNYNAAFPSASTGMGCPTSGCGGYELMNDLDFDTDGDGTTHTSGTGDSGDSTYYNSGAGWTPIGARAAAIEVVFDGNGHVIYNLFVNRTTSGTGGRDTGLFGAIGSAGVVRNLGVADAYVSSASDAVGALVGRHYGRVEASWASGSVTGNSGVGGLAGSTDGGSAIVAGYSTASVTVTGSAGGGGGLAGWTSGDIAASYSTGAVTGGAAQHGLAGGGGAVTASYWDLEASGVATSTNGAGRTTSQLQSPTAATGPYAGWDRLDLDGDDDPSEAPWDFGTSSEYPALRVGANAEASVFVQRGDYDSDDDGLIDVYTLAHLNAIRWDMNGDGASSNGRYRKAFRHHRADMGCPATGCAGYELMNDLDFDTDGDDSTHINGTGDPSDAYYNGGSGWDPIGAAATTSNPPTDATHFNTVFDGKGHVIHNLFIDRSRTYVGLFGALRTSAVVRGLGLRNAWVDGGWSSAPLAGQSWGRTAAVWATGTVEAPGNVGGLVGVLQSGGTVVASYSTASVECTSTNAAAWASGLVGENLSGGSIAASYATGAVTGMCPTNRKFGLAGGSGAVVASYWDTTGTGIVDDQDSTPPEGRSRADLRAPTGYTGIYADWDDQDVDGDTVAGEAVDDDAWDFGDAFTHPVLKFGGLDTTVQFGLQPNVAPTFSGALPNVTVANGQPIDPIQAPTATGGEGVGYTYEATGLPSGLVFDADGTGTCQAARTICGTPSGADGDSAVTVYAHDGDVNRANSDRGSLSFTLTVVTPTATISATSPAALTEATLDGATVTVTLTDSTFLSGAVASRFRLDTTVVTGLLIDSVTAAAGGTTATLTLDYDDTDFDATATLGVTVLAAAHALKGHVTTATVNVTPSLEATVSPANLSLNEAAGSTSANEGTFTAVLDSAPAATTEVTVASFDQGAATVDPAALTFTTSDWNSAQTVTVTARQDDDADNESTTVTLTAAGVGELARVTVAVADDDLGTVLVDADPLTDAVDPGPVLATEGATAPYYGVRLSAQPTADVAVAISSSDSGAVGSTPSALTFTTANWNTLQTVRPTIGDDADAVDESATLTHTATGGGYNGTSTTLRVAVSDDERTGTDYDTDEDGLIEISTLAQLHAVRWDLNGDGSVASTDQSSYNAAFPSASTSMGCRAVSGTATCTGYELVNDLDFDTDGDGATHTNGTSDSGDEYHNSGSGWHPIGPASAPSDSTHFIATFDGNGHSIHNLFVDRTRAYTGLFAALRPSAVVRSLGLVDAWVDGGNAFFSVAPLAGQSWGRVEGVWATGTVRGGGNLGGLVGVQQSGGTIVASYSKAAVVCADTRATAVSGGLVGDNQSGATIVASYATGAVTGNCPASAKVGLAHGGGTATASYWDTEESGLTTSRSGAGRTTMQLQSPTAATGPYASWGRLDLDGDSDPAESPWDFGTSSDYPALRVGTNAEASVLLQRGDHDVDDDGLIEIHTLAQLNAVRWDLDGDGAPSSGNAATYRKAFRNHRDDMGCPTSTIDADDNDCTGYELEADLDFDTDGDGSTWALSSGTPTSDSDDAYHNSGAGWTPIGSRSARFNTTFAGNGHVVKNLFVNRNANDTGFFSATGTSARITALGLEAARLRGGAASDNWGPLAGYAQGRIAACWATGHVRANSTVAGLVGRLESGAVIVASYSAASVEITGSSGRGAGFVSWVNTATIRTSYSIGAVSGGATRAGFSDGFATVVASYWDTNLSGVGDDANADPPEGRSTNDLQRETSYAATGIYGAWDDQDVDGDGNSGEAEDDDAWDFGAQNQHPVLKFGGFDTARQFNLQTDVAPSFGTASVSDVTAQNGRAITPIQIPAPSGGNGMLTISVTGLPAGLSYDADGSGDCSAARTICGTPSGMDSVATVTITASDSDANTQFSDRATLTFMISVVTPSAAITATNPAALTESNLDNATVTVTLTNTTFESGVTASSFTLNTGVPGLDVDSVATVTAGDTAATLTLDYNGMDFDTAQTLSVTVVAAAHGLAGSLTTATVNVAPGVGVRVAPPSLSLSESATAGGGTSANVGTYTVVLESQPTGNVTVTATSADAAVHIDTDGTPLTYALTFTTTNWETAQSVTATAQQDTDARDESVSVSHAVTGYPGVTTATSVTVAVDDDETAEIVVDADPQTTNVDEAGPLALQELTSGTNSASYTIRLTAPPTQTVTVTVTSADTGAVTVNDTQPGAGTQNTLTFTSTNWATAQTVTLTAAQDADGVHESVVVTNAASTASTSEYTNVSATLTATVQDDEAPGFVFDADPSTTNMDEAGPLNLDELAAGTNSASYAVRLTSQPTQDVTVSISSPDTGAVTVGTSTLTFTTTNWDTRQTVALTAVQDLDGADEEVDIAHAASTASTSEYTGITGDFAAAVDDDETPAITLSPTALNVNEEDDADYTVALATQPKGGGVTVAITGAASGISASPTSLTFTASNWNTAQTVTASAVNDQNSANEQVTLTHTASGADYDTLTADLEVTALDDDTPSLRVTPTALTVPEAGSRTYTVRLNTQPSATVTVTVSGAASGVTVDTDSATTGDQSALTFTDSTWETNQTVTVSAAADDNGVDEVVSLSHAAAGGDYATITGSALPGVSVTADDDDAPAVLLDTDPQTTTVDEPGPVALKELAIATDNSENHTVRLSTEPSADVTVAITSADADAVASSASALTFTSANWDTRQTVTLTAQQDADGVNESVVVTHAASTASTSEYTNVSATLTATVEDDEAPAFVFDADPSTAGVVDAAPLNLDELSTSPTNADDYSVKLSSQPTQDVTVAISSPDTGAVTVGASSLTFTTTNWNTPQTVTATAAQDLDGADESVDVAHAASTATPSEYTGITGDFEVAVDDDETAGLTLSPASLTVQERRSETYTVVLDTEPKGGNVTVSISGAGDGISASPTRLVFTAANWNTARTVTARAADDANSANEVVTLTHAAGGADYDGVSEDLEVTASDDDQPGLRVSPTQLTVREEAVATYRVRLNAQPSAAVTVTVGGATAKVGVDTDPDTTGDQTELAFDATDWNRWKTVRVRGIDDDDGADETASLTHAVAGASEYTGLALLARPGVAVTVDDRDVATVALSLSSLALSEGGGAAAEGTWTVRLANLRPTGPVSVAVTSGDPAVALTGAPVTLNFTTANWDTAQSVSARAVDDDNAASERVEVRHAASGANYGGAEAVLRVVVTDDEAPPDAPTGLAATPGDGSAALSWSNPENPSITRYEHRYAREGAPLGEWLRVPGAGPNTTSLTVSGLVNGRAYVFEVRAGNEIGDGPESRTAARLAAAPAAPATVPDAALAAAVRAAVGKSASAPLTAGDLAQVLELDLSRPAPAPGRWRPPQTGGEAVRDLRGMEAMPNLRRLYLDNNEVADLSPLLGLVYLEHVSVRGNPLTSDSVFVHAAALRARGVEVLLDAATLATLSDPGLRRAVEVALGKDPGAALTEGDLLTLSSLSAESAGVASLSGIEAASRLESLTLSGNAPAAGGAAMSLSPLAGLRSLTHLDLSDNGLTDVSALAGMTGLRSLLLAGNALEDLSPLSSLTGLEELTLSRNGLSNVSALSGLSSLRQLWLDGNALESVKPLRGLSSLVYLHLGDNRIADVEPLAWLADLRRLWLPGNRVEDVSALASLWRLSRLDLERNRVSDVSPLAGLPELSQLRLGWNRVADVSALADHAGLADGGTLGLRGNPLGRSALEHQVPALRRAGAAVVVGWPAPLFPSASDASGRGGFVRVLNRSEAAGEVLVEALDEAGRRVGPVRLALGPRAAAHFNSADLERGNAAKGLPAGVGRPTRGSWRLLVSSALDVEVLSYLRAPDGSLAVAHGELPRDGGRLSAFFFNPGGDREQRSSLRVFNPGATAATAWPWGVDDAGRGRSAAGIEIPAGATATMSSRDLESSRWGRRGLGDGEGRWRLRLGAPWPLAAQSLLEGPNGHLSNLSPAPVRAAWTLLANGNAAGWDARADWALRLPLFPPAPDPSAEEPGRDGLARVVNLSPWEGWAQVAAVDDAGVRAGPVRLRLPPRAAVHFDSAALEAGGADRGPTVGVGAPTRGAWRLELRGNVAFAAAAYMRAPDGFLTSLHEAAPSADGSARVALFNPASNARQRSLLRLANDGAQPARATITGMDDAGAEAGPVSVTVPAGEALTLTAFQLEQGGNGLQGALGDGEGKWRLTVAFDRPLTVMSLIESLQPGSARRTPLAWESADDRLSNLSATPRP